MKPEPLHPLISGVFAFLDSLPDDAIPRKHSHWSHLYRDQPGSVERKELADFINETFRLQWRECPLRPVLAAYRLYFRDDMADALAAAYLLHRDGKGPEEAFRHDYTPGFLGLLKELDIEEFRKAEMDTWNHRWWNQFASHHKEGDRFVEYDHRTSRGYLLFRGDRLVWKMQTFRYFVIGASLRWKTDKEHFIALGNTKGFLNGDFTWPPVDWVNPVTDEGEKAYDEDNSFKKIMERNRAATDSRDAMKASSPFDNAMMAEILGRLGVADPDLIVWDDADAPRVEALKKEREAVRTIGQLESCQQEDFENTAAAKTIYRDMLGIEPEVSNDTQDGFTIEPAADGMSQVFMDGTPIGQPMTLEEAQEEMAFLRSMELSPPRVAGLAIAAAGKRHNLSPDDLRELSFATEDIQELLETIEPTERRAFIDKAIDQWAETQKEAAKEATEEAKPKTAKQREYESAADQMIYNDPGGDDAPSQTESHPFSLNQMMDDILAELGLPTLESIDDTAEGFIDPTLIPLDEADRTRVEALKQETK
jgi:hypothetical protein